MLSIHRAAVGGGDRLVLALRGQVDLATAPQVTEALAGASREDTSAIVVDLTDVDFLDSAGVRALVESAEAASESGVRVSVEGAHGWVAKVLEITGVRDILNITSPRPAPGDPDRP